MCTCTWVGRMWSKLERISQQKVADVAGVSRGTVDRVINGKPNVKPETKERVLRAITELGYSPNTNGRALALCNREFSFCAVYPGIEIPYFSDVLTGIDGALNELHDFNLSLESIFTHGLSTEDVIERIDACPAQAFMVALEDTPEIRACIRRKTEQGIPVITFNTDIHDCGRLCFVGQDLYKSGRIAASLMLKLFPDGSAGIVVVTGNTQFQAHRARTDGFADVIRQSGKDIEIVKLLETDDEQEKTYDRLSHALRDQQGIDGIYLASGHIEAAIRAIKETGKKYSVVVNDLSPMIKDSLKNGTFDFTIYQNPYEQGYRPIRLLFDFLLNGQKPSQELYFTENTIITDEVL